MTDVTSCIFAAYSAWRALPTRIASASVTPHICESSSCEFVQVQCVFICKASGNLHVCTMEQCNSKCDMREYRACSVTRTEYPLQLVGQTDSDNVDYSASMLALSGVQETKQADFVSTGGKGTGVRAAEQARKKRSSHFHKTAVDKDINMMRSTVRKVLTGLLTKPTATVTSPSADLSTALLPFARSHRHRRGLPPAVTDIGPVRRVAAAVSTRRFRERVPVQIDISSVSDAVIEDLQTRCVDMWMQIRGTQSYLDHQHAYDFKYHCLVILYMSIEGFDRPPVRIPALPLLRDSLPKINEFYRFGYGVPTFNNTNVTFRQCLHELVTKSVCATAPNLLTGSDAASVVKYESTSLTSESASTASSSFWENETASSL